MEINSVSRCGEERRGEERVQVDKVTPACLKRGEDLPLLLSQLLASPYIDSGRANISVTSSGKQLFCAETAVSTSRSFY